MIDKILRFCKNAIPFTSGGFVAGTVITLIAPSPFMVVWTVVNGVGLILGVIGNAVDYDE